MKSKIARIGIAAFWLFFIVLGITNIFTSVGIARGFIIKGDSEYVPAIFAIACLVAIVVVSGGIAGEHLLGFRRDFDFQSEIPKDIKRNVDFGVAVAFLAGGLGSFLWLYKVYHSENPHEFTVMYINLTQASAVLFLGFGLRRMSRVCAALLIGIYALATLGASSLTEVTTPIIQSFFLIRGLIGTYQYRKWVEATTMVDDTSNSALLREALRPENHETQETTTKAAASLNR